MGSNIIMNILMIVLLLFLLVVIIVLVLLCKHYVIPRCPNCFKTLIDKIYRKLFWNSVLRACLESYLTSCIFVFH